MSLDNGAPRSEALSMIHGESMYVPMSMLAYIYLQPFLSVRFTSTNIFLQFVTGAFYISLFLFGTIFCN